MIVWSGWGILAALIPIGFVIGTGLFADATLANADGPVGRSLMTLALLAAAAVVWILGRRFNGGGRVVTDKETGREITLRRRHSLLFIPMQYWPILIAGGALYFAFSSSSVTALLG